MHVLSCHCAMLRQILSALKTEGLTSQKVSGVALRRQVPGLVRNISEKKRLQWRDYAAQFATHALADLWGCDAT